MPCPFWQWAYLLLYLKEKKKETFQQCYNTKNKIKKYIFTNLDLVLHYKLVALILGIKQIKLSLQLRDPVQNETPC